MKLLSIVSSLSLLSSILAQDPRLINQQDPRLINQQDPRLINQQDPRLINQQDPRLFQQHQWNDPVGRLDIDMMNGGGQFVQPQPRTNRPQVDPRDFQNQQAGFSQVPRGMGQSSTDFARSQQRQQQEAEAIFLQQQQLQQLQQQQQQPQQQQGGGDMFEAMLRDENSINNMIGRRLQALEVMEKKGIDINKVWDEEDEEIERRVEAFEKKYAPLLEEEDYDDDEFDEEDEEEEIQPRLKSMTKTIAESGVKGIPVAGGSK